MKRICLYLALFLSGLGYAHAAAAPGIVCFDLGDIATAEIADDKTILFHMQDGAVWENLLPEACPGLEAKGGFEYSGNQSRLCGNIDVIRPLNDDTGCVLGPFVLYAQGR